MTITEPAQKSYSIRADDQTTCLDCHGYGGAWTDVDDFGLVHFKQYCSCPLGQSLKLMYEAEKSKREEQSKQAEIDRLFGVAKIPQLFEKATLADFAKQPQLLAQVERAEKCRQGLFLWGVPGTGKTHLAVAVLSEKLDVGTPGLFIEVPDMLARIRETFNGNGASAEQMIRAVCEVDVLVLDDLGAEKPSEWVKEQLFRIVNTRYSNCRFTVVTTNLTQKELALRIGERTVSRLIGMCDVIQLDGVDRRKTR